MSYLALLNELQELERAFDALRPELELTVRDDAAGVEGHVIVWSTQAAEGGPLHGLGKGGTRITPTVSREEIAMLARIMALKNAAAGLPLGGAKSGLRADPSDDGFEATYRRFVKLCEPVLHVNGGPFGGFGFDIGARPEHALWACDELGRLDCFTGKPLHLGGTDYDREGIAGYGVATAAEALVAAFGKSTADVTFGVQGLGAMGSAVFKYMAEFGAHPVEISDIRIGGTWKIRGIASEALVLACGAADFEALAALLLDEADGPFDLSEIIEADVDVLFPCATQDTITKDNVESVRASFIVEGANSPCAEGVHEILCERGIGFVPDIVANPGGVIAAFVEMTSDATPKDNVANRTNPTKAKELTREKITLNVNEMLTIARDSGIGSHEAARLLALRNLFGQRG